LASPIDNQRPLARQKEVIAAQTERTSRTLAHRSKERPVTASRASL